MNTKTKNCLLSLFVVFTLFLCSISSFFTGIIVGDSQDTDILIDDETETVFNEVPVYYEQETSQRYFDENSPQDIYLDLINDSTQHFSLEYSVSNSAYFTKDKDFILANLEHQYSRLSVIFDTEISSIITVKLEDDFLQFQDHLGISYDSEFVTHSGYALGNDLIELYINPLSTVDKFYLAQTCSHELVHIFQYELNDYSAYYLPTWFVEGMAEGLSFPQEKPLIHKDITEKVTDITSLESFVSSPFYIEYTIGYDACKLFFLYLLDTYGEETLIELTEIQHDFDEGFNNQLGLYPNDAYQNWLNTL